MPAASHHYCVIMAGGIGSRFWPMSRTEFPKQFHDILGTGHTLIQDTFNRLKRICPPENILVVTNDLYFELVKEQLPEIPHENILTEPSRRNTAPCIAYAAYRLMKRDPDASMVVAPSDHLIVQEDQFEETLRLALNHADNNDHLITLGVKPSRPDTGYGYIQFTDDTPYADPRIRKVKTFTEKPGTELAKEFVSSGEFFWNSGIFIWNVNAITEAFREHLPEMHDQFAELEPYYLTEEETEKVNAVYATCENISIDFGIMEKASNVDVVLSDFGWSDLGTWGSLYSHLQRDENGNAAVGKHINVYDAHNNVVNIADPEKLVVLQGLRDYIVVDTPDVLLICKKEEEQKIKQFVSDLRVKKQVNFV